MPLIGYTSLCKDHASKIVSKDKGGSQSHIATNKKPSWVTHYKIDGVVITTGNRCDYLLINEDSKTAYLIELKGSDLSWAARQLEATEKALACQLSSYGMQYRIVANRCKTQEIETTEFKRYRMMWKRRLKYASNQLSEDI